MNILVSVSPDVHLAAVRKARALGHEIPLPPGVLNAPLDDQSVDWSTRIWDAIEEAIARASEGLETLKPLIDRATGLLDQARAALGRQYESVTALLAAKLRAYLKSVIDDALSRVEAVITVGSRQLAVTGVTVGQRISFSSSLKIAISEVCQFAAQGELTVSAEYGLATP